MAQAREVGAPRCQALEPVHMAEAGRPAGFSLPSLPPVLLRAHPEGGHEAASLAQPLELQGAVVAQLLLDKLQS